MLAKRLNVLRRAAVQCLWGVFQQSLLVNHRRMNAHPVSPLTWASAYVVAKTSSCCVVLSMSLCSFQLRRNGVLGAVVSCCPSSGELRGHARPQRGWAAALCGADREEASGGALHRIHALRWWVLPSRRVSLQYCNIQHVDFKSIINFTL